MFGILRRLREWLGWGQTPPQPRRAEPAATGKPNTTKTQALSAAEIAERMQFLPRAKVIAVLDGDTVIVAQGPKQTRIRLDSIDCPEDGQLWGDIAKDGLTKLVGGQRVALEEHGLDFHGRTLATVYVRHSNAGEWLNVNEQMVILGHAWVMRAYWDHLPNDRQARLDRLETWAKSKKAGLWSTDNPTPPWEWRKNGAIPLPSNPSQQSGGE